MLPMVPAGQGHQEGERLGPRSPEAAHGVWPWCGLWSLTSKARHSQRGRQKGLVRPQHSAGVTSDHGSEGRAHNNENSPPPPKPAVTLSTELTQDLAKYRGEQTVNSRFQNAGNSQFCRQQALGAEPLFLLHPKWRPQPLAPTRGSEPMCEVWAAVPLASFLWEPHAGGCPPSLLVFTTCWLLSLGPRHPKLPPNPPG